MTRNDDFIGQLEAYLDEYEGNTPLPEHLRGAIRAQLPETHQRQAWWPARRFTTMNNAVKYGVAAVVVAAAAFLGFNYLVAPNVGGPDLGPPSPSAAPSVDAQSADEALVRAWIDAVNVRDFDAAAAMMSDPVETGGGTIEGADQIATHLEMLHPCMFALNSLQRVDQMYLVEVTFKSSDVRTCPEDLLDTTNTFVIGVGDGEVVRIP